MPQQFRAEPSTLRKLILQAGQGFYVPMYQRDFTWGEAEIDRLFEDLDFGLTRAAGGQTPSTFLGSVILVEDRDSVSPKNADALPPQVLHVVDGQQRLTTLLILFAVLTRALAEHLNTLETHAAAAGGPPDAITQWVINNLKQSMESLLDAISIDSYIGDNEYRKKPRLIRQATDNWGNNAASAVYGSDVAWFLMEVIRHREQSSSATRVSPPATRPHLDQVVRQVEDSVDAIKRGATECEILNDLTFVSDIGTTVALLGSTPGPIATPSKLDPLRQSAVRLVTVANFLLAGVLVIDVRAPDEDYAFALFEPLNTTGQLLTALETLKPLVVQAEGGTSSYAASPSGTEFARLEAYFPPQVATDEKSKRISEFLVSFALAETGERLSRNLIDQRQYLRSQYRGLAAGTSPLSEQRAFVDHLAESGTFLFEVWRPQHAAFLAAATNFDRLAVEILRATNHTIVIPILERYYTHWAHNQTALNRDHFLQVLRAVTVFWTLWRTSRSTTKGIDDIHRKLMEQGLAGPPALVALARRPGGQAAASPLPDPPAVKAALRSTLSTRGQITSKQDWVTRVAVQQLYQTSKTLAKFVLLAAHEDSIDDPNDPGLLSVGVAGAFSCLHLDAWAEHYSVEHVAPQSPAPGDTTYEQAVYEQGLVDRIGNLTLMPSDLNSLVKNRSWAYKRSLYEILADQSPQRRLSRLQETLPGLAQVTRDVVLSAQYLPFCRSLALNSAPQFTADFIQKRGERLASLTWDCLWTYLA